MSKKLIGQNQFVINVALVGKYGCGKTAILVKYCTSRYIYEYSTSINDLIQKEELIDGHLYCLNIQDFRDSDETYNQSTFNWADIVLVVYSITSRSSYYRAMEIIKLYSQFIKDRKSIAILVANKSDLADLRLVQQSESIKTASELGIYHIECNVIYDMDLIRNLFHQSVRLYNQCHWDKNTECKQPNNMPSTSSKFMSLPNRSVNSFKWTNNKPVENKPTVSESAQKKGSVAFRFFSKKSK